MSSPLLTPALLAALAISTAAQAQPFSGTPGGVRVQVGSGFTTSPGDHRGPRRDGVLLYSYGAPEGWAYFNNRSFAPDSYNDWWHDRPDRSFPRWMSHNEGCQRVWWSGGGWRC
ncbi:hypothetical protein OMW55_09530 [Sphingomonas sp. BN140010]|uniref:Uncharacterized protein n=1 Tax=Sphingomonas arvum TaxID=2992113 RepID=A0ABT3JG71_9SPHN|nr:hypothetical protein [Sphingomonas sp. BN140010]MCW3798043.1 hypothetical protein [Sphingomonas sp. BN140010]